MQAGICWNSPALKVLTVCLLGPYVRDQSQAGPATLKNERADCFCWRWDDDSLFGKWGKSGRKRARASPSARKCTPERTRALCIFRKMCFLMTDSSWSPSQQFSSSCTFTGVDVCVSDSCMAHIVNIHYMLTVGHLR